MVTCEYGKVSFVSYVLPVLMISAHGFILYCRKMTCM